MFYNLDIKYEIREPVKESLHFVEGRGGDIIYEGEKIGSMGEVHPKILKNWKIKMPVSLLEISLEKIFQKF
ncbi:hypothetical protein J4411_02890 [Candidatus Pacearchaeota archaeon]|nr:hypothetical protein [Candidatus Pacearchaeota archaeon]